jgi:hypothetical protein
VSSPVPLPIPDVPPAQASQILCGPWASPSDVPEKYRDRASTNQWLYLLQMAGELLYQLTGHHWLGASCDAQAEIRSRPTAVGVGAWPFQDVGACGCWRLQPGYGYAAAYADAWFYDRLWGGRHPAPVSVLLDPAATAVTSVTTTEGVVVPADAFRLDGSGWLQRTDGGHWSACGVEGPTLIEYAKGRVPPGGGVAACVQLAIEFLRSMCGEQGCAIPQNATQITRQGVTISMDFSSFLKESRTGVPMVDLWINSVNPARKSGSRPQRPASVWTPDVPTATRIAPPA